MRHGSAGGGGRVLERRGGGRSGAAEALGDLVEGLALCLWDFNEGEDEKEDEEGSEDEEDPRPAPLLRKREESQNLMEIFDFTCSEFSYYN